MVSRSIANTIQMFKTTVYDCLMEQRFNIPFFPLLHLYFSFIPSYSMFFSLVFTNEERTDSRDTDMQS